METFNKKEGEGRKASASYTIKAFRANIDKLYTMALMTEDEKRECMKAYKNAVERFVGFNRDEE